MNKALKIGVLSFFMFLLSFSLIFDVFQEQIQDKLFFDYGFVVDKKLNGVFDKLIPKKLSFWSWTDGSFQENRNNYTEENIAFRDWLVKIKNQVHFSLFGESSNNSVLIGKDNILFEKRYLDASIGKDFLGEKVIDLRVQQLQKAQEKLQAMGKNLLVVFAPSKPHLFPNNVPTAFKPNEGLNTNYRVYKRAISKSNLNFIDINSWMLQLSDTCRFTLVPNNGAHWSNYLAAISADSIIRKMESLLKKPLRNLHIEKNDVSRDAGKSEEDLLLILNLLKPLPNQPLAQPILSFSGDSQSFKPYVISISDSYYWNFIFLNIPLEVFNFDSQYWYYNKKAYTMKAADVDIATVDFQASITRADLVLIIITEPNLIEFPYGFDEEFNNVYK